MNKQQLINTISEKTILSKKDTETSITTFAEVVGDTIASNEDVLIIGFGKFFKQATKGRTGVSKLQGEEKVWKTEDSFKPAFSAGKQLKEKIKG
jgi:DNA-binding protein HU-beta